MTIVVRIEEHLPTAEAAEAYLHDMSLALDGGRQVHHFEYGIRIAGGRVLDTAADRVGVEALLPDYQATWADSTLVRRAVYQDEWEEVTNGD